MCTIVVKRRSGLIQRDDIAGAENLLQSQGLGESREILDEAEISFLFPPAAVDGSTANAHGRSAGNSIRKRPPPLPPGIGLGPRFGVRYADSC
jgi:hypothetical protein